MSTPTTKKFIKSTIHLPVRNLRETLDYYRDVLGFHDEWTWPNADGKHTDGGIRRDDLLLVFGEDPGFVDVINGYTRSRLPLLWFAENIEAIYKDYTDKGVSIADPLRLHPYGLKEFAFVEVNGYYVRVAEEVG
jgi:catechol 2,3-dioxygenase-like lactoylglutathione lyase family enzyme